MSRLPHPQDTRKHGITFIFPRSHDNITICSPPRPLVQAFLLPYPFVSSSLQSAPDLPFHHIVIHKEVLADGNIDFFGDDEAELFIKTP
jgi:hypothetical protein